MVRYNYIIAEQISLEILSSLTIEQIERFLIYIHIECKNRID